MAKLISRTYGEALFELAAEENKIDVFIKEIKVILQAYDENPEFLELMTHPKILKEEKLQMMKEVFEGRISKELIAFFELILSKDRYGHIKDILQYFLDEEKKLRGVGVVFVTTPSLLSEIQKSQVESRVLETTSFKALEMHYNEDETLIGGMIIRIGDRIVDSSIRTKLEELTKQLVKIQLA